jgi:hypothetical protein
MFLICQDKEAFGMSVVYIPVRQEGMKQGLDGGVRRAEMDFVDLQLVLHLLIREMLKRLQLSKLLKLQSNQSLRPESGQVDSAPFDIEDIPRLSYYALDLHFDRGVPSAMQDKARIPSDQARSVKAQRHDLGKGGIIFYKFLRLPFIEDSSCLF